MLALLSHRPLTRPLVWVEFASSPTAKSSLKILEEEIAQKTEISLISATGQFSLFLSLNVYYYLKYLLFSNSGIASIKKIQDKNLLYW